jgi:hypothetical protein
MGGRKGGGFAARPQRVDEKYQMGTLSEHGKGNAVDIEAPKNRQLKATQWAWLLKYTGKSADLTKETWKKSPDKVWEAVNEVNEAYKTKLKAEIDTKVKPPEAPKAEPTATPDAAKLAKADAKADPAKSATAEAKPPPAAAKVPTRAEAAHEVLKGQDELIEAFDLNGEAAGFFELPKELVVALHGQDLVWGATFKNPDLHHFEME